MNVWTDGSTHIHLDTRHGKVYCYRDGAGVASAKAVVTYESSVSADLSSGTVYRTSSRYDWPRTVWLHTLPGLEDGPTFELPVRRLAALGGGRIAAILGDTKGPNRLVVGVPGQPWEEVVVLSFPGGRTVKGLCANPPGTTIQWDPRITVNDHGMVVSDGQTGVVALRRPGASDFEVWRFNGAEEVEVFAEATPQGVLVVGRWTARDSVVWHLHGASVDVLMANAYSAHAHWVGDDTVVVYSNSKLYALRLSIGEVLAQAEALGTSYRASAGGGATVVLTVDNGLVEATWTGAAFQQRFLPSAPRFDVSGALPARTPENRREYSKMLHALKRGLSDRLPGRGRPDGRVFYTLEGVAEDQVEEARRRFLEAGAPEVTVAPAGP